MFIVSGAFEAIWIISAWSVRSQWCSPGLRPTPRHARFQNETISWTSERHIHIAVWFHVRLVPSTTLSLLSKTCISQKLKFLRLLCRSCLRLIYRKSERLANLFCGVENGDWICVIHGYFGMPIFCLFQRITDSL